MKKILVPTDFSKCANNAMNFALELATRAGASVHILHVIYPNEGVDNSVYNAFWIDEYYERRKHDLENWAKRFRKNAAFKDVNITASCEIGFPVGAVKKVANEQKADLIVMGTTGATGLRGATMGSTASGVISEVHIPVFAIPTKANFLGHTDYVMATDFDVRIDKNSLKILKEILRAQHAGIHVLHVLNKPGEEPDKSQEAKMKPLLEDTAYQFHYLHDVNVPRAINNFIETIRANGLIVISHHHSFLYKLVFQRVSRVLTHHVKVPILALHDK